MSEWLDEFKEERDELEGKRKIGWRIYRVIATFVISFLIGVIAWAAVSAIRQIKANETKDTMIVELEHVSDHRVFYDTETGVMYVEYSSHGGISPMYNPDGSLRVYKE